MITHAANGWPSACVDPSIRPSMPRHAMDPAPRPCPVRPTLSARPGPPAQRPVQTRCLRLRPVYLVSGLIAA